jgi:hypothetical protein
MAQVKGILVNDGGAPARIINFLAGEAVSAGQVLKASTAADMTCLLATDDEHLLLGVALTDAALGDMCSVVTGSGVICYVRVTDETAGISLMVDGTPGQLDEWSGASGNNNNPVAMTLEVTTTTGLTKCMLK